MSRKIKLFIVCSVVLNLLLAGAIMGGMTHRWGMPGSGGHGKPPEIEGLSAEKQKLVHEGMKSAFEKGKELRKEIGDARQETMRIYAAEPFDAAAYQAQVDKMMSLYRERRQAMSDAFKELATKLTPEERAAVAKAFQRPRGAWGRNGSNGHKGPNECPPPAPEGAGEESPPPSM